MDKEKGNAYKRKKSSCLGKRREGVVAHHTSVVPGMKDPSTRLRSSVSRVEDASNETKSDVSTFSP